MRNNKRTDRVLNDEEASDLYQKEIDQSRAEIDKAQAYCNFFEYCRERLISSGAKTIADLSVEEHEIISQKHAALVEKYGPAHNAGASQNALAGDPQRRAQSARKEGKS